jgi:hypothetical protein
MPPPPPITETVPLFTILRRLLYFKTESGRGCPAMSHSQLQFKLYHPYVVLTIKRVCQILKKNEFLFSSHDGLNATS